MNWVLEHLQIIIAIAAAIAYYLNRRRGAADEDSAEPRAPSMAPGADDQVERTRRIQEEIRRKIAERRGATVSEQSAPTMRERVPPLVRPARTPPIDPFGGPMRKIIRELEAAAEKRLSPPPDPEEAARKVALERQERLAAQMRALEAERLAEEQRAREIAAMATRTALQRSAQTSPNRIRPDLRDPRELRRAIVLREILGTPVGSR